MVFIILRLTPIVLTGFRITKIGSFSVVATKNSSLLFTLILDTFSVVIMVFIIARLTLKMRTNFKVTETRSFYEAIFVIGSIISNTRPEVSLTFVLTV